MGRNQIKTCELIAKTLTKGKSAAEVSARQFLNAIEQIAGSDERTKQTYSRLLFKHEFATQKPNDKILVVYIEENEV